MQLLPNWQNILRRAWSVKLIILAAILSGLEVIMPLFEMQIAPNVFAALAGLVSAAALVARILAQPGTDFWNDESGAVSRRSAGMIGGTAAAAALAISFVGGWEGLRTKAYQDVVGVWTICYGATQGVRPGDAATKGQCDDRLRQELIAYEAALDHCLEPPVEIPLATKVAFVSWTYNVGPGAACRSTLVRKANAGDLIGACNELPRWNRAGGRVIRGLTNRRVSERNLCLKGLEG